MRPARRVIIIHAQPTSSPPKPTAISIRPGVMRNNISNGKSADGLRRLHHNLTTTAAPTPARPPGEATWLDSDYKRNESNKRCNPSVWLVCDIINLFGATLKKNRAVFGEETKNIGRFSGGFRGGF